MKKIHPIAGVTATLIIAAFWISTVGSELFGSAEQVRFVKLAIPWCFIILIPSLALAGGTGHLLSRRRSGNLIAQKRKRMPFVAANGIVILIPCALFLAHKADTYTFDTTFYTVQVVELVAGAVNLTLLSMNLRDGLRLTNRRARKRT